MKTIDARKLNCPQPLIMSKDALEAGENEIIVLVDNETPKLNIVKYCNKMGYSSEAIQKEDHIEIKIKKTTSNITKENLDSKELNDTSELQITLQEANKKKVYFIGTNLLGSGSEDLGKLLMKGFLYTITQVKPYPEAMIFLNSGVKLTCENSDSIDDLSKLLQAGTKIVSCGTCLDFYQLKDKLKVGEVSNMYDIVEIISASNNVMSIS